MTPLEAFEKSAVALHAKPGNRKLHADFMSKMAAFQMTLSKEQEARFVDGIFKLGHEDYAGFTQVAREVA